MSEHFREAMRNAPGRDLSAAPIAGLSSNPESAVAQLRRICAHTEALVGPEFAAHARAVGRDFAGLAGGQDGPWDD